MKDLLFPLLYSIPPREIMQTVHPCNLNQSHWDGMNVNRILFHVKLNVTRLGQSDIASFWKCQPIKKKSTNKQVKQKYTRTKIWAERIFPAHLPSILYSTCTDVTSATSATIISNCCLLVLCIGIQGLCITDIFVFHIVTISVSVREIHQARRKNQIICCFVTACVPPWPYKCVAVTRPDIELVDALTSVSLRLDWI